MDKLFQWLETLDLEEHVQTLADNDIDFDILPHLTEHDLRDLGFSIGHRRRFLVAAAKLAGNGLANGWPTDPLSFFPSERVLHARGALEGERKQATVLFADIVDSTRLTYGKDADEADIRLSPAIDVMRKAVFHYEGYARPRGDGIQGIFGVPLAHEDHALRGCYAALDILVAIAELNARIREESGEFIQVRIGINSGELLVKGIHDDLLMEIDAIGPMIAVASRMESMTPPGTAQITSATMALVEGFVDVESGGRIPVKGIDEPIEVFQLKGARTLTTRFHGKAARGLTRFVGRQDEMGALAAAWSDAANAKGRVVTVFGEPGVGKSRLFWEFTHSPPMADALVLEASSVSYGKATSYRPLIHLIRQYFKLQPNFDDRRIKERVNGKLMTLDEDLLAYRSAIFDLLGLDDVDQEWLALDPLVKRQRTIEAVTRVMLREANIQPLCLVFEDLHWTDTKTEAVLDAIVDATADNPILLLVNHRPEYDCRWRDRSNVMHLHIGALPEDSAEELLNGMLGCDQALTPLKEKLIDVTLGNPFFLEETVQTLKELAVLTGSPGHLELSRPVTEIEVPVSVQSTLAARIDRLHPNNKLLLQYASVIGKNLPFAVLEKALDLSEDRLQTGLAELQDAEFLYQAETYPRCEYSFKHALTYQVAYNTLPKSRRQAIHNCIMQAIEELYTDNLSEHVEDLAYHALQGEEWESAARYAFLAGKKSYDRSANEEAVSHLECALGIFAKLPRNEELFNLEFDVRLILRQALLNQGEVGRIGQLLDETKPLLEHINDSSRRGKFEAYLCNFFYVTGDQDRAIAHGHRAMAIAESVEDQILMIEMSYRIAQAHYERADHRKAIELLTNGLERLGSDRELDRHDIAALPAVICRTWLSHCFAELGDFERAMQCADHAVMLADRSNHPLSIVLSRWGSGHVHLTRHALGEALIHFERGLEVSQRWHFRNWLPRLLSSVGLLRAIAGKHDSALGSLEDAIRLTTETGHSVDEPLLFQRLARVQMIIGEFDAALLNAKKALRLSSIHNANGLKASSLHLLSQIYANSTNQDLNKANEYLSQAIEIANDLSLMPLFAECQETLAELRSKQQRHLDAEKARQQANLLFNRIGIASDGLRSLEDLL